MHSLTIVSTAPFPGPSSVACKSLYPESWRQGVEGGLGARDLSTTERRESLSALKQIPRWGCAIVRAGDVMSEIDIEVTTVAKMSTSTLLSAVWGYWSDNGNERLADIEEVRVVAPNGDVVVIRADSFTVVSDG